jgi:hypothetical protein
MVSLLRIFTFIIIITVFAVVVVTIIFSIVGCRFCRCFVLIFISL